MTKTFSLLEYIGNDVPSVILHGVSVGIFIAVGYGIYKTLKPSTPDPDPGVVEGVFRRSKMNVRFDEQVKLDETRRVDALIKSRITPKSDIGIGDSSVRTSDEIVQKFDITDMSVYSYELKQRVSSVKDIVGLREIYGDKLVDSYLATQVGEEIDIYEAALELEKWKRFSELFVIYELSKEHGIPIPDIWALDSASNMPGSYSTSGGDVSITSSSVGEGRFLSTLSVEFANTLLSPTDTESPNEGGVSVSITSSASNESGGYLTPID